MRHHDIVFLKHFSQVMGILVTITIALILLGAYINGMAPVAPSKAAVAATHERIRPLAAVYAGPTGAAAQAAAAAESAQGAVAFDGSLDGAVIYAGVCTGCHTAGVARRPGADHGRMGGAHSPGRRPAAPARGRGLQGQRRRDAGQGWHDRAQR